MEIYSHIKQLLRKAEEIAREHGIIVGRVSRNAPSSIDKEGGVVIFDVDPETYFTNYTDIAQSGSYLAVVDVKSGEIVSLRVVEVHRQDMLSELNLPEFTSSLPRPEASGLLTRTRIKAKPLLAYNPIKETIQAANYVIEPQSPIIKPVKIKTIQKILGLPTEGVFLGFITIGDRPAFNGYAPLYIPLKAFYQHVLVLGTTGSGKTTLLKNMIASICSRYNYKSEQPSIIIMDPNKDYVHLPLRPIWEKTVGMDWELESHLIKVIEDKISKPSGIVIILPITQYVIDRLIKEKTTWVKALRIIAQDYFNIVYRNILERIGALIEIIDLDVVDQPEKGGFRYVLIRAEIKYGDGIIDRIEIYVIPYGFRFNMMNPRDFIELNPFFTQQARDALYRILLKLKKEGITFNTLQEFYNVIQEARYIRGGKARGITLDPRQETIIELIHRLAIHRFTLENIIRQLGSMVDTGFFDIEIPSDKDKYLIEPSIEAIMEAHFRVFKGYPIVIDLEYLQENSPGDPRQAIAISAFRILNKVFTWKLIKSRMREDTQPVLILIDEAHRFFPSYGGGRDEYAEHVSGMIDRIARLGRARRLGIIFSTHSPKDVHDIILQLTNTKIILRMDKSLITRLEIPSEYRDFIVKASDRVGVIKTHALRLGYTSFRTTLPLTGHYDLSALEIKRSSSN
ncbi:MAG: DUF87 domain-containing protein [Desulfurococcales archaeon]|nr:DUF87 domain-containing protein [Desulfurococcales archaeon]